MTLWEGWQARIRGCRRSYKCQAYSWKKQIVPIRIRKSEVLEEARKLEINISQTVDVLLANEVRRLYWEKWNEQNKDAIAAYNARVAAHGLPLTKYRTWGAALGDGQEGS